MSSSEAIESEGTEAIEPSGRSNRFALTSLPLVPIAIISMLLIMAIAAPLLSPYAPTEHNLIARLRPPFWIPGGSFANPLGTDLFGRDVLSRIIYGARVSLSVALIAIIVAGAVGTAVGLMAGYFGGIAEIVLMRIVDAFLAVPAVLVAIVLASVFNPSFENVIIVIGLL
jgi:peptide/nickel transport system permease protein